MPEPHSERCAEVADAAALIDQLRAFADGLGPTQRQLLAALLAPGIDAAWRSAPAAGDRSWSRSSLPHHLVAAVRARRLRIVDG